MKKISLILILLQFSLICFSQTETKHHYTDQEVNKLATYIVELEKKIPVSYFDDYNLNDKKQITVLFNDTSHNYFDEDIIKIYKYIKDLEKKNLSAMSELEKRNDSILLAILLVKGTVVFEDTVSRPNYSAVSITVTDKQSSDIIGVYTPNSKSGRYLFILSPGKKYLVTAEMAGYHKYSEDFSPKSSTESYEMVQEIKLKKE